MVGMEHKSTEDKSSGEWPEKEAISHITMLEMRAFLFSLSSFHELF